MAKIVCKTSHNSNPRGKPRVFFTCHPKDFDQYFDQICNHIFRTHDCAIYYTENMDEEIPEQELDTVLGSNNLLVIPVTRKLLTKANRAMDQDVPYALRANMPILPIIMEPGLDEYYSHPDKFGKLQYLSLCAEEKTAISFNDKLRKYLEAVLISDEMAQRIRAAFDAYIFLSYRKKDRDYANELMRMIHRNSHCRDIAIWYDEFLTPGESFNENIEKILHNSKLFTLLVTPNLLEEPGGNPNYVMANEYPAARSSGITILPAEMEPTDKETLSKKYQDIPQCVPTNDDAAFQEALTAAIQKIAVTTNDTDPEHIFLIGLAYLEGIDVEVDHDRGIELITKAAESPLPEAMKMLSRMYASRSGKSDNRYKAIHWAERYWEYHVHTYGEKHPNSLAAMFFTAQILKTGRFKDEAMCLCQKVHALQCEILGEDHSDTVESLLFLADMHQDSKELQITLELYERAYASLCKTLGEADPKTISVIRHLADVHRSLANYSKVSALYEKIYSLAVTHWGAQSYEGYEAMSNMAAAKEWMGDYHTALQLYNRLYASQSSETPNKYSFAIDSLHRMAELYGILNDRQNVLRMRKKIYAHQRKTLGKENPKILESLDGLIRAYEGSEKYTAHGHWVSNVVQQENYAPVALYEKAYALQCKTKNSPDALTHRALEKLATVYETLGRHCDTVTLHKNAYTHYCERCGEESSSVFLYLRDLSSFYREYGYEKASQQLKEAAAALQGRLTARTAAHDAEREKRIAAATRVKRPEPDHGYKSDLTLDAWDRWHKEVMANYHVRSKYVGDADSKTLELLRELAWSYVSGGNLPKALELYEKMYHIHEETGNHQGALDVRKLTDSLQRKVAVRPEVCPPIRLVPCGDREYRTEIIKDIPKSNNIYLIPCGDREYRAVISQEPPEDTAIYYAEEGLYPAEVAWTRHDVYSDYYDEEGICTDSADLIDFMDGLGRSGNYPHYVDFVGTPNISTAQLISFYHDSTRLDYMDYLRQGGYTFAELEVPLAEDFPTVHLIIFDADPHLMGCLDYLIDNGHKIETGEVHYVRESDGTISPDYIRYPLLDLYKYVGWRRAKRLQDHWKCEDAEPARSELVHFGLNRYDELIMSVLEDDEDEEN